MRYWGVPGRPPLPCRLSARPPAGNLANVLNAVANCVNDDLLATHI